MKFKIGDKVKIVDKQKACGCTGCQNKLSPEVLNKVYTVKLINGENQVILDLINTGGNFVWVRSDGLKEIKVLGQLLFEFMEN